MNDDQGVGIIRVKSGTLVDLNPALKGWFPDEQQFKISDIAWGLGRTLRYNGHIRQDYTVAHHSIIMSYYVPERFAMEALLHDAAEAYMGDVVSPVKKMVPDFERIENAVAAAIMLRFGDDNCKYRVSDSGHYKKSGPVAEADHTIFKHECFMLRDRPGEFDKLMHRAWVKAVSIHNDYWSAPQHAFVHRFIELQHPGNDEKVQELIDYFENETAMDVWYADKGGAITAEQQEEIEMAAFQLQAEVADPEAIDELFEGGRK